ncbi:MAG: beta-ketoacyl-[acyl-carrier-protein] synthase family protein [Desulfobacterales bacterium]|nr:MAG: beta-ketoacyl-[acyl-carrier-protein] synthase family protein [Desulfobacterales bacterium]
MSLQTPVAVSGIGCLCGAGSNLGACLDTLFHGRRQPAPPARFSSSHPTAYPVFEIPPEVSLFGTGQKPQLSRTARLVLTATREALGNSGWDRQWPHNKRIGVCIGTTVGSTMNDEGFYRKYRRGDQPCINPIETYLNSNPAQAIAREFDLSGPCQTVVNACSSGTDAIGLGAGWIRSGICDAVIAGGADELCRVTYDGFISLMITDDSPCKPFDATRKGLNLGEGAAILILESQATLRARNHPARAFVRGYGSACDAYHLTAPDPQGQGLRRAIAEALATSGQTPAAVAFVNAHGTGTRDNDRIESRVLSALLPDVPFFSTKGCTGHTLAAAGAIEAAFTVAFLEAQKIPPSAGFTDPDPDLPASPAKRTIGVSGQIAFSQSLAFGGNNAVIVFGKGDT